MAVIRFHLESPLGFDVPHSIVYVACVRAVQMASKEENHDESDKELPQKRTRSSASTANCEQEKLDGEEGQTDKVLGPLCNPRDDDDEEKTLLRLRTQCVVAKSTIKRLRGANDSEKTLLENRLQELGKGRKRTIEKLESLRVKRTVAAEMWGWKQYDVVDLTEEEDEVLTLDTWRDK